MYDGTTSQENSGFFKNLGSYAHQLKCRSSLYDMSLGKASPKQEAPLVIPSDPWPGDKRRGHDILQGLYSYEGQNFHSVDVLWQPDGFHDGWLTAMHGFDMLRDLRAFGGDRARQHARYLMSDWLDNYYKWHPLAWRPDIVARRIVHWLSSYSAFCASAEEDFCHDILDSIARQMKHLSKHARSGDLLCTAKALFYGGMAMGQENWCRQGLHVLAEEIQNAVLSDGGHKSRSPENHLMFLQNLLDIRASLHLAGLDIPDFIAHTITKMSLVLRSLRHNDGGLCLFHGGGVATGTLCDMVLGQAAGGSRPLKSLGMMGYDRLSQGRTTLLVDTGSVTDTQTHAGLLAFEMSAGRDRIIVNCGSWAGHPSWQEALRSTAAHSTVVVEECNAVPRIAGVALTEKATVKKIREDLSGKSVLDATHDGYLARFGVKHRRVLTLKNSGNLLQGKDILKGVEGVSFAIRFHLHPEVRASVIRNGEQIMLRTQTGQGWYFSCDHGIFSLEESIYVNNRHCDAPRHSQQITVYAQVSNQETTVTWKLERI